jgi:hypothetical protein
MADATLSRDGTSVTVPLVDSGSGAPLVSRDIGKPHLALRNTGEPDPYFTDEYSGLEQYTLTGRFYDNSAYTDAITLADLIKNHGQGNPITLDLSVDAYESGIKVVPAAEQESAVSLTYAAGDPWVTVDINLTRVSAWQGSDNIDDDFLSTTPTASGTGPIQVSDGTTTVDMVDDVNVERTVGRPNSTLSRRTDKAFPQYIDRVKTAYDAFGFDFQITESNVTRVRELNSLLSQKRGSNPLTLDFNGLYGLGEFSVMPVGARMQRDAAPAGYEGVSLVPSLTLRRVRDI